MNDSILTSIKKLVHIAEEDNSFDTDIIIYINSAFMNLNQLGVGPVEGFSITNERDQWSDFIDVYENPDELTTVSAVKTYIYLKVKLIFDPPANSSVMKSYEQMISELEWRLNVASETK